MNRFFILSWVRIAWGLPRWLSGKESAYQHRRWGYNSWVGKIPWRRKWQPTPVFLPGEISWTEEPPWAAVHRVAHAHTQTRVAWDIPRDNSSLVVQHELNWEISQEDNIFWVVQIRFVKNYVMSHGIIIIIIIIIGIPIISYLWSDMIRHIFIEQLVC